MIAPKLSPIVGTGNWILLEDWSWSGFAVPAGFITDLDTVPRIPGVHAWLKGRTRCGALLHDYLYHIKHDRKSADDAFYLCMIDEGVKKRYAKPIYKAVRLFGGSRYNEVKN